MSCDWTPAGGTMFMRWEYYGDFAINLILNLSENQLPEDLGTVHQARNKFFEHRSTKAYLFAVMDFGEKFGANMNPILEIIQEADRTYKRAIEAYLDLDYSKSLQFLDDSLGTLAKGSEKAIRLKNHAKTWIYVIEWATVTGTFSICGLMLWTLMVRRRLYREPGISKFIG